MADTTNNDPLLQVRDLEVRFNTDDGVVRAVNGIDFEVAAGETLGVVGESGSGKSVANLALLGLIPQPPGEIVAGSAMFRGRDLLSMTDRELADIRGNDIAMIFQDPMTALNPFLTIEQQLTEVTRRHLGYSRDEAIRHAIQMLKRVGIPNPEQRLFDYPHLFSGGMRQRVMIAIALSCKPDVLIADEPTTALDVTTQAQILDLMKELQEEEGAAIVLITHDLGVVAGVCDRVVVMNNGQFVETADCDSLFAQPQDPYTISLLQAVPRWDVDHGGLKTSDRSAETKPAELKPDEAPVDEASAPAVSAAKVGSASARDGSGKRLPDKASFKTDTPLLVVKDLKIHFQQRRGLFRPVEVTRAVDSISFDVRSGETFGLVGESGCGKSTTARGVLNLIDITGGEIWFDGKRVDRLDEATMRPFRRRMQLIFQDPFASLNPRMTIGRIIMEPMAIFDLYSRRDRKLEAMRLMDMVGLNPRFLNRYPHEFSGGQRQRVGIARALAVQPKLIVCDEPVSALDVSIQAQVMNLLMELKERLGLALVFISHDLAVVRQIADRVGVMKQGQIVEQATARELYENPQHEYTQSLLAASPIPDPQKMRERRRAGMTEA